MLVLNLACAAGHVFEGWFGSSADYDDQQQRGLLSCPLCNSPDVRRMLSAPRINLGASRAPDIIQPAGAVPSPVTPGASPAAAHGAPGHARVDGRADRSRAPATDEGHRDSSAPSDRNAPPGPLSGEAPVLPIELQRQVLEAVRRVMAQTEDVGDRFADEARRMHYGDSEERAIRGRATPEEAQSLVEEGIEIVPLPIPEALKDPLQ